MPGHQDQQVSNTAVTPCGEGAGGGRLAQSTPFACFLLKSAACAQARLDHATAVGERQRVVEEEERAKMAALAEHMSNESAQREGEVRRRHEAAMAKLALNREQQVTNPFSAPQTSHRPATIPILYSMASSTHPVT